MTWAAIEEDASIKANKTDDNASTTDNSRTTTITYKNVTQEIDHGYVTLTAKIPVPTITLKDDDSLSDVKVRYSINGKDQGEAQTAAFASHNVTISKLSSTINTQLDFNLDLTVAAAQKAMSEDGYITGTYTVVYDVYDSEDGDYDTDLSKNKAKPIASVTEKVIVKIEASSLTLKDTEGNEVWNAKAASDYKATLVPATPTEEDKTTEENKKDDVPKTGEVI